jgi:hypothetical protein
MEEFNTELYPFWSSFYTTSDCVCSHFWTSGNSFISHCNREDALVCTPLFVPFPCGCEANFEEFCDHTEGGGMCQSCDHRNVYVDARNAIMGLRGDPATATEYATISSFIAYCTLDGVNVDDTAFVSHHGSVIDVLETAFEGFALGDTAGEGSPPDLFAGYLAGYTRILQNPTFRYRHVFDEVEDEWTVVPFQGSTEVRRFLEHIPGIYLLEMIYAPAVGPDLHDAELFSRLWSLLFQGEEVPSDVYLGDYLSYLDEYSSWWDLADYLVGHDLTSDYSNYLVDYLDRYFDYYFVDDNDEHYYPGGVDGYVDDDLYFDDDTSHSAHEGWDGDYYFDGGDGHVDDDDHFILDRYFDYYFIDDNDDHYYPGGVDGYVDDDLYFDDDTSYSAHEGWEFWSVHIIIYESFVSWSGESYRYVSEVWEDFFNEFE